MTADVLPFHKPAKRDADGVLHVPPATLSEGKVYVFHGLYAPRQRKKRWFIVIEYLDCTHDVEHGPADWKTCMFLARVRARKYGFRVVDLSDLPFGAAGAADGGAE